VNSVFSRFDRSESRYGAVNGALQLADRAFVLRGLTPRLRDDLATLFGPYWRSEASAEIAAEIQLVDGGPGFWNGAPQPTELYRIDPLLAPGRQLALSYSFALEASGAQVKLALASETPEPLTRTLENALRLLVARHAAERGGFAMHSAAVVRDDRAWIFAGPSRAGKSTAVRLSAPAVSIGDDFGLVLPDNEGGWWAPALPFDNGETAPLPPQKSRFNVAGIWKLVQDKEHRLERPRGLMATTSLTTLLALPWVMPDLAGPLLEHVGRFCEQARFEHLHFTPDAGFWTLLERPPEAPLND
jgi:hypothetical protein